jgi:hypothetical protein
MDKEAYIKLLKGAGKRYKNTNLYVLDNKASTVEERAAGKICPPANLNPNYATIHKIERVGKIKPRQQQQQRQQQYRIHPDVLRFING